METVRKQYTPEQKVAILREHLLERQPISAALPGAGADSVVGGQTEEPGRSDGRALA